MSHVGFADHYEQEVGPDAGDAENKARATVGANFSMAFIEAIAALDAAAAEERSDYCSTMGIDEGSIEAREFESPLADHVGELMDTALDYLSAGLQNLGGVEFTRRLTLTRITDAHRKLAPYCTEPHQKTAHAVLGARIHAKA